MNTIDMPVGETSDCPRPGGLNLCPESDLWRKNVEDYDFEVARLNPPTSGDLWQKPGQVILAR